MATSEYHPGDEAAQAQASGDHNITENAFKAYWRENLTLMGVLLSIWFMVSFGAGILFRDFLDQFSVGGAPMGFWFAQQGAIYTFVVLIFVYSALMHRIERKYDVDDDEG
jgi:putative solute:sodium symporter small subunit